MIWRFAIETTHFAVQFDRDPALYFYLRIGRWDYERAWGV